MNMNEQNGDRNAETCDTCRWCWKAGNGLHCRFNPPHPKHGLPQVRPDNFCHQWKAIPENINNKN